MRVLVTGSKGMLGAAVCVEAKRRGLTVRGYSHLELDITNLPAAYKAVTAYKPDVVINCAGIVKGLRQPDVNYVLCNGVGPHILAECADMAEARLIHVSTDCVYSGHGKRDGYYEDVLPDPPDLYGRSKLAGEVYRSPHLTVRTSFIGFGKHGLLNWVLNEADGIIPGYTDSWWNGLTAPTAARALIDLALSDKTGLIHLGTQRAMSKNETIRHIVDLFGLQKKVADVVAPGDMAVFRVLLSRRETDWLNIPPLPAQITELAQIWRERK